MSVTTPAPAIPFLAAPDISHIWCCDPTTAWCGENISDSHDCDPLFACGCIECKKCREAETKPCPQGCNT